MKFRFHKGDLLESLKTKTEVNSIKELINLINKTYPYMPKVNKIKFKYVGYDNRIKWDTYNVIVKFGGLDYSVAGMSDGILK